MTAPDHVEREAKLEADPDLVLPDLGGAIEGITTVALESKQLDATYYDTADLRLLAGGVTARRRTGEGTRWTVKLAAAPNPTSDPAGPSASQVVSRREIDVLDEATDPPAAVLELVASWLDEATLAPVARVVTDRRRIELRNPQGVACAEVDDDRVTVHDPDGGGEAGRFHEIEIELADTAEAARAVADPAALIDAVVERLVEAGARTAPPQSKVERALGLLGRR